MVAVAAGWDLKLLPFEPGAIAPADRLVVSGPSAIAATVARFAGDHDLDWYDQVICVASPHDHRQLAALAGAAVNATKPTRLFAGADPELRTAMADRRVLLSDDASPEDRAAVALLS